MSETLPPPRLVEALSDRYRIQSPLGEGGMATVYRAEDLRHHRRVAIKVLRPELAAVIGAERFLAEIRTTANLQHPHILPLFDSGEVDGLLFYVMPYVEGESLRDRLDREKELPVEEAVRLAEKVAGALDYAHRQGVVHRDIKPGNILLQDGEPLVADFGIALAVQHAGGGRLTETGLSLGTPTYMAPEQASGDRVPDVRSDVYALGCVLYEMLAGRPPHVGNSAQQVLAKVLTEEPPPLTGARTRVPTGVAAAVTTALQRIPADRFGSTRDFAEALRDPGFRGLVPEGERPSARRPGVLAMALAAVLALGAGLVGGRVLWGGSGAEAPARFRQFTTSGTVGCAAISPDGTEVAMIRGGYTSETGCAGSLVVQELPAGAPLVLVDTITRGAALGWSPDGSSLILRGSVGGGERGLWVVPLGAGAPRRIDVGRGFATFKTADSVVVFWGEVMEVLDPRSGAVLRSDTLSRFVDFADWSEEAGAWVAMYYDPGRDFGVAGVLGLMDEQFEPTDSLPGYPLSVSWAGPRHLFVQEAGPHELSMRSLRRVTVSGGRMAAEPRILRDELLPLESTGSSSSDGRRMVVVLRRVMDEVVAADLTGGPESPARILTRSVGSWIAAPSISPDGERVAFFRNDLLGPNPYVLDGETGRELPLGSREGRLRDRARWTPDGRGLVLSGHPEEPLAVVDLEAGTEREIQGTRGCHLGTLDGGEFVYVDAPCWDWAGGDRLRIVDPATGVSEALPEHPGTLRSVVVEPGTDRIWVTLGRTPGGDSEIQSLDRGGTAWTEHGPFPGDRVSHQLLAVDPEGRLYWMEAAGTTRIYRARPGSEAAEVFREFAFECAVGYGGVTPDLSRFICNAPTVHPDAWLVELGDAAAFR